MYICEWVCVCERARAVCARVSECVERKSETIPVPAYVNLGNVSSIIYTQYIRARSRAHAHEKTNKQTAQ